MKTYCALAFLILFSLTGQSQEYSFPLYFEDSAGNKDTLHFGFDQSASFGMDEALGERNLQGQAKGSPFSVFFTDAVTRDESDCRLENEKQPTYLSKKQYINKVNDSYAEIGVLVEHWPIKISWNKIDFQNFITNQYLATDMQVVISNFHPFNGYPDIPCCYQSMGLMVLSDITEMIIDKSNSCQYMSNFSVDSIGLFYVGQMCKYTSVNDLQMIKFQCWYNEKLESVSIQNAHEEGSLKFEVFNLWGMKILEQQIFAPQGSQMNINISHLRNGIYFIRLLGLKDTDSLASTFKIIKR